MNFLKNYFLAGLLAISSIVTPSSPMELATQQLDPETIKMIAEEVVKKLKQGQHETIAGNFSKAGPDLINAAKDVGLGISRCALNSSVAIRDLAEYFSHHYILLGAFLVSSAYFWWYIWPNITVRVHYNSDHRPHPCGR